MKNDPAAFEASKKHKTNVGYSDKYILLAGNPNVGKSTVFNALTGLKQHTGNWSGKTVDVALGKYVYNDKIYLIADLPGCYSIKTNSSEEYCAAQSIRGENVGGIIVVCDACSIERNLNLVLQICEISENVVVAVNFLDDAASKGIKVNLEKMEKIMGVPILAINARKKYGLSKLVETVINSNNKKSFKVNYGRKMENSLKYIIKALKSTDIRLNNRYLALRILENDVDVWDYINDKCNNTQIAVILNARHKALNYLFENGIAEDDVKDLIAITLVRASHNIYKKTASFCQKKNGCSLSKADRFLTGKISGFLVMFALLGVVFYLTLKGANYPSKLLSKVMFSVENVFFDFLISLGVPHKISSALVYGGYRVLSWVVSVMLPPMAIFFPLFTILEDIGYLPRIAFNMDKCFKKCNACGKQALTTCMGFGCNAAGVTGARIIDSPRDKLIAILTNSFIPCNGKFPAIISIITVFMTVGVSCSGIVSTIILMSFIILAIISSFIASKVLAMTVLKGTSKSFTLELPPFRKPQFTQILVRSVFDRTIFVLGRAAAIAFPAGILIYILNNITVGGNSLIQYICNVFDPFGKLIGLDGVILTAFVLGIPANEIVLPLALMIYTSGTILVDFNDIAIIRDILISNGWTMTTAVCTVLFYIMHWPCSTTLLTVKKETGSFKWMTSSFVIPTIFGIILCLLVKTITEVIC